MRKEKKEKGAMKVIKRFAAAGLCTAMVIGLAGCSSDGGTAFTGGKRIIRISHAQSETHPEHIGLLAFKEYIEENLGDKYEVEIYPNELLGAAQKAIKLTQTGAIDFVVAGTANLETFADVYEVFSMPYLFTSEEAYHATMEDTDYMENIYSSTDEAGFRVLTWYNAGTRNIYATTPIETPEDLEGLSDEEYEIFQEAARISTEVEMEEWDAQVEEAKDIAQNDMGVEFIDVDIDSFKAKVEALHEEMLSENADIVDLYDHIQEINEQYADEGGEQ